METPHSLNIPGYTIEVLRTSYPDVYAVILDGIFYRVVLNAIGTPEGFESMGESRVSLADMRGWRIRNDDQVPFGVYRAIRDILQSKPGASAPRPPMISSRRFIAQQVIEDAVEYNIQAKPEDEDFRGNASAIDPETDRQVEEDIARRLDQGDIWAWCNVEVSAKYEDPNTQKPYYGYAYLGGCSYADEDDFKNQEGGYYTDMKAEALEDLKKQLEDSGVDLVRPPLWG